jgi:hypothetical protein
MKLFNTPISEKRERGSIHFKMRKGECETTLGSRTEGRLEDAATWWCAMAADVGIDPRWKTTSWANWTESLFELDTVVEIKHTTKIEWIGKEIFGLKENCEQEFGPLQFK